MASLPSDSEADVGAGRLPAIAESDARELLIGMAHDMRSPLGSILLLVERMRTGAAGPLTPLQERHLGLIYSAAFGLASLTSDVMEMAHGGARLIGAETVPLSVAELLRAVRDVVQPVAEEKGLLLRCSGPPDDIRLGHPAAIHRVLLNLTTNALKFTHNGSVSVVADALDGAQVRFRVDDTGRGLPEAVTGQLGRPVAMAPIVGSAFSSSGLGITICRQLLDRMGSDVRAEPLSPVGTRFEFVLDLPLTE